MKLQASARKELRRISAGVLIGSGLMVAAFAAAGRFSPDVLWGALLGDAVAIGNFLYLCLSLQKAVAGDETRAKRILRVSYAMRMLVAAAALLLGLAVDAFHWLAVLIPLLLPRVTILVLQITGAYRPDPPAARRENRKE